VGEITRLALLKSSAGAAAGMTVIGSLVTTKADAAEAPAEAEPVVAYVKDPTNGKISVMSGDREVIITDHQLAAQLSRAAR
jgi:hypothetical protein